MSELAIRLINEAFEKRSTFLDLGNCGLTVLPLGIEKLSGFLEGLNLGDWYYDENDNYATSANGLAANNFLAGCESFARLRDFTKLTSFNANSCGINFVGTFFILSCGNLTVLNLAGNSIGEQGAEHISRLGSLTRLNLFGNHIGDRGAAHISKLTHLDTLDLGDNSLTEKGVFHISKLTSLVSLDLVKNKIKDKGAEYISRLQQLDALDLSECGLTEKGAAYISRLPNLISLTIWGNKLGETGARHIGKVKSLVILDISDNGIGDQGLANICGLPDLQVLDTWANEITGEGAEHISRCSKLTMLDIAINNIGDKGAGYISKLSQLGSLDISNNDITDKGARHICKLSLLTSLEVNDNELSDAGIRELIRKLPQLTRFKAAQNRTQEISPELLQDVQALRALFSATLMIENNRIKMVLIGNSTAGKTSLAQWLAEEEYIEGKDSTHGIQHWVWKTAKNKNALWVNIWDFGGQDYYHATHEIFLGNETLFLFLKSSVPAAGNHAQDLPDGYWLGYVSSRCDADTTPLWFVQTKTDLVNNKRSWLPHSAMELYMPEHQCHISVQSASRRAEPYLSDFDLFRQQLKSRLQQLVQTKIPETWAMLRDEHLPRWRKTDLYLTTDAFKERCIEVFAAHPNFQADLERSWDGVIPYLSKCGDLVVFPDQPSLRDKVFLGAKELTDAMYTVLSRDIETKSMGIFTLDHIKTIANGPLLMEVLQAYGLIFEDIKNPGQYVAPQFLPVNPHIQHFQKLIRLSFAIRFPNYMSRSVITRFITKYASRDKEAFYWRYGAFFPVGGVYCFVRIDAVKQIVYLHVEDVPGKFAVMRELFDFFAGVPGSPGHKKVSKEKKEALSKSSYDQGIEDPQRTGERGMRLKQVQLSLDGERFASAMDIQRAIACKAYRVQSLEDGYIEVNAVLHQLLNDGAATPKRIFFSYSRKDAKYREELQTHFAALKRSGKIDTWSDVDLEAGQEWDKTIKDELNRADIVMLLLSPDFMATDYIWNTEIPRAIKEGKIVVPIFLRPCDWNEEVYGIDKYYALPAKSDWIVQNARPNRDEGYLKVVEGIKSIL